MYVLPPTCFENNLKICFSNYFYSAWSSPDQAGQKFLQFIFVVHNWLVVHDSAHYLYTLVKIILVLDWPTPPFRVVLSKWCTLEQNFWTTSSWPEALTSCINNFKFEFCPHRVLPSILCVELVNFWHCKFDPLWGRFFPPYLTAVCLRFPHSITRKRRLCSYICNSIPLIFVL